MLAYRWHYMRFTRCAASLLLPCAAPGSAEKRIKPPVPSNCFISGLDFATRAVGFAVGQPCRVNIMTHKTNGGDTFLVDVLNPKGKVLDRSTVEVHDRGNGTYTVQFTPHELGEHQLMYVPV